MMKLQRGNRVAISALFAVATTQGDQLCLPLDTPLPLVAVPRIRPPLLSLSLRVW